MQDRRGGLNQWKEGAHMGEGAHTGAPLRRSDLAGARRAAIGESNKQGGGICDTIRMFIIAGRSG